MKKIIALLLALVMIFALCACGGGEKAETAAAPSKPAAEKKEPDSLSVEGVSFEMDSLESYVIRVKSLNNSIPTFDDREIVNVVISFRLLDASGNSISANRSHVESFDDFTNLAPGQSCWTSGNYKIDKAAVDAADTIEFTGVEFRYSPNAQGEWTQIKEAFSEPYSFKIADVLSKGEDAFKVENVSVEFMDSLPNDVLNETAWSAGIKEGFDYSINDSETYAAISFSITNLTKQDVELTDGPNGDFRIELNFDDGYIFSPAGSKPSFFREGDKFAILNNPSEHHSQRLGKEIILSPLVTYDVQLYLCCAKAVSEQTDKSLVLSFQTAIPGYNQVDVSIR